MTLESLCQKTLSCAAKALDDIAQALHFLRVAVQFYALLWRHVATQKKYNDAGQPMTSNLVEISLSDVLELFYPISSAPTDQIR